MVVLGFYSHLFPGLGFRVYSLTGAYSRLTFKNGTVMLLRTENFSNIFFLFIDGLSDRKKKLKCNKQATNSIFLKLVGNFGQLHGTIYECHQYHWHLNVVSWTTVSIF